MAIDAQRESRRRRRAGRRLGWRHVGLAAIVLAVLVAAKAWFDTMREPVVRQATIAHDGLPMGQSPIRIALLSDIHVAGPDMPPERVAKIVAQVNRLRPDLVLIAGDLVSEKRTATRLYSAKEAIAPLAELEAPLGKIAVPGNHDHWFNMAAVSRELEAAGFTLLANDATRVGPLVIGGLDDDFTGRADMRATVAAMEGLEGAWIVLSHSPDPFRDLPRSVPLMLAGHTHCGQIAWPWGGSPATMSDYGERYACGRVDENGKSLIVGAGLGTSVLPFRLFTQPEIWLIELVPTVG